MNIQTELSHIQTIKNSAGRFCIIFCFYFVLNYLLTLYVAHGGIYAPDIVSYGHKISYTTSAPPGWVPAQVCTSAFHHHPCSSLSISSTSASSPSLLFYLTLISIGCSVQTASSSRRAGKDWIVVL